MKRSLVAICLLAGVFMLNGCKKEDTPEPSKSNSYTVPTTYNFSNVAYTGQKQRLAMLTEISNEMKKGNSVGTAISAQKLKDMYNNAGSPFVDTTDNLQLNTSGKKIKDKVYAPDAALFEAWFDSLEACSMSSSPASNGVAGVATSGSSKYLLNSKGVEYNQIIQKTLMGAFIFYQIGEVYLGEAKIGDAVNNTTVKPGEGTPMEHAWDEAFGYFGVPVDFPANLAGLKYIGNYSNQRNALLGCNKTIMNAYLKGRAAISNKDMATKKAQITIIRNEIEKVLAASAIHYMNEAVKNITDDAKRCHALSEGYGFINALKYSSTKKISDTQLNEIYTLIGDNFYNVTTQNLSLVKDKLSAIYGFSSIKDTL
jgi:hypothetical protein